MHKSCTLYYTCTQLWHSCSSRFGRRLVWAVGGSVSTVKDTFLSFSSCLCVCWTSVRHQIHSLSIHALPPYLKLHQKKQSKVLNPLCFHSLLPRKTCKSSKRIKEVAYRHVELPTGCLQGVTGEEKKKKKKLKTTAGWAADSHTMKPQKSFDGEQTESKLCGGAERFDWACGGGLLLFPDLGHLLVLLNNIAYSHWKPTVPVLRFLLLFLVIGLI